jgi:hypothetical protein
MIWHSNQSVHRAIRESQCARVDTLAGRNISGSVYYIPACNEQKTTGDMSEKSGKLIQNSTDQVLS